MIFLTQLFVDKKYPVLTIQAERSPYESLLVCQRPIRPIRIWISL